MIDVSATETIGSEAFFALDNSLKRILALLASFFVPNMAEYVTNGKTNAGYWSPIW
jgi:hypothetical protein